MPGEPELKPQPQPQPQPQPDGPARPAPASNTDHWLDIHIYFTAARPDMEGSMLELARTILHEQSGIDLITGLHSHTCFGRPDFHQLLASFAAEAGLPRPDVFFCGPEALARDLTGTCQSLGLQFSYERF